MNRSPLIHMINPINSEQSTFALEQGKILFFPENSFSYTEAALMSESILDAGHKNISYDYKKNKMGAFKQGIEGLEAKLQPFMHGYAEFAFDLVRKALPLYVDHLQWGRTSFRPAQIKGRKSSKRKDDTRLHVDSFAATPVNGLRILRVFCNINPQSEPRVWHVGEGFTQVLAQFSGRIPKYSPFKAKVLKGLKATKTLRSAYDHYMLHLHDSMKLDDEYQAQVQKTLVDFPAQSSWIVFTDHVSHAALSGQYLLEQTFYLPVEKMQKPELSPFFEWRKLRPELTLCGA